MKVIAVNGSPRNNSNTEILIKKVLEPLEASGIETEIIQIGNTMIPGCLACNKCGQMKNHTCTINNDPVNDIIMKMKDADGIIFGSPTYFADITPQLKALIDRAGYVACNNGDFLKYKVGAAVVAAARSGATHAVDTIHHMFQYSKMFIVGTTGWNSGFGYEQGEVTKDINGMENMYELGQTISYLLNKLNS